MSAGSEREQLFQHIRQLKTSTSTITNSIQALEYVFTHFDTMKSELDEMRPQLNPSTTSPLSTQRKAQYWTKDSLMEERRQKELSASPSKRGKSVAAGKKKASLSQPSTSSRSTTTTRAVLRAEDMNSENDVIYSLDEIDELIDECTPTSEHTRTVLGEINM